MQIYYIFTFEGLKLQKTIFGQSSGKYGSNFLRISRSFYVSLRGGADIHIKDEWIILMSRDRRACVEFKDGKILL